MPNIALNPETDDIVLVQSATADAEYECPDCEAKASFVRSFIRQNPSGKETRVRPHFRYPNCGCYGKSTVEDRQGGGNGGGGGGESSLHKRRKKSALAEALSRFQDTHHETEMWVGEKRADAVLVFEDGHEKYGKGLAIEYQHKNENKDITETEREYAQNEFTTIWLTEEQYDFSSLTPEIDLFGGRVYTPWPDAVPKQENWSGLGKNSEVRKKWSEAKYRGLTDSEVPATIIKDWVLPTTAEYWQSEDWKARFSEPKSTMLQWDYSKVPATIPKDWVLPTTAEYWQSQDWSNRFCPAVEYLQKEKSKQNQNLKAEIPFAKWFATNKDSYYQKIESYYQSYLSRTDWKISCACPHCSKWQQTMPRHKGETKRSTRCSHCQEWFVVFS